MKVSEKIVANEDKYKGKKGEGVGRVGAWKVERLKYKDIAESQEITSENKL